MSAFFEQGAAAWLAGVAMFAVALALAHGLVLWTAGGHAPPPAAAGRHVSIDGLRGFLALGVLLHHFVITYFYVLDGKWTLPPSRFYTLLGQVGVATFFMVTGFLFWRRLLDANGRLDWKQLFVSRLFRIVPLYVFALLCVILAVAIRTEFELRQPLSHSVAAIATWLSFARTPDINLLKDTWIVVAGVTWTLHYEWLFYASLPLFAYLLRGRLRRRLLVWCVPAAVVLLAAWPLVYSYPKATTQFLIYFLAGALAAAAYRIEPLRRLARGAAGTCVALAALIVLFASFDTAYGVPQAALLLAFFMPVALGNTLLGVLDNRAAVLLGDVSYSIYLLHGVVLYFVFSIAFPQFFSAGTSPIVFCASMAATVALVLVQSWLTFRFVEQPFVSLGRRIRVPAVLPAPALAGQRPAAP